MNNVKKRILVCSFLLLISVSFIFSQNRIDTLLQKLHDPFANYVFVVAHRGDWRYAPENSISAIENVIEMGVDIVELDVQRTRDGKFILMHDATLNRTTTGKGEISDWDLDSIRTLKLKNGINIKTKEKVPTLEEALMIMKDKILINLDKADRFLDEIFPILEKTNTTRQVIMKGSGSVNDVRERYKEYLEHLIYMPIVNLDKENAEQEINLFLNSMSPVAFELLFMSDSNSRLPLKIKDKLTEKSLIWYNTLWDTMAGGHDDDMSLIDPDMGYGYLIEKLGARIIQTDRPQYLINYLNEKGLRE